MDAWMADWRFWMALISILGAGAGMVIVLAEVRFRIAQHARLLDPEKLAQWNRRDAAMIKDVETLVRDMACLKADLRELIKKYDRDSGRLWEAIEKNSTRVTWCEAKINGRPSK